MSDPHGDVGYESALVTSRRDPIALALDVVRTAALVLTAIGVAVIAW